MRWRGWLSRARVWLIGPPRRRTPLEKLGAWGERRAADHLRGQDYRILGRNVRTRAGEIDLLAETPDGGTIVVVEVKTRVRGVSERSDAVPADAAVNAHKRDRLRRAGAILMSANRWHDRVLRIDIITVEVGMDRRNPRLRHLPGAG